MNKLFFYIIPFLTFTTGCGSAVTPSKIEGEYRRVDSNQFARFTQLLTITPIKTDARDYRIVIKSDTKYLDGRSDRTSTKNFTGTFDAASGLMRTEDPGITLVFEGDSIKVNDHVYKRP